MKSVAEQKPDAERCLAVFVLLANLKLQYRIDRSNGYFTAGTREGGTGARDRPLAMC